ncbi:hypothetical protein [Cellulomonas sp. URHB0016]
MTLGPDVGSGFTVAGGRGPTVADLDDLTHAVTALETAVRRLDQASDALAVAQDAAVARLLDRPAEAHAAMGALTAARTGAASPARAADDLREVARRLRQVVEGYDRAESWVHRLMRSALEAAAADAGSTWFLTGSFALPVLAGGAVATADGVALHGLTAALREKDPGAMLRALRRDLEDAPGRLLADGRAELALDVLAQYLVGIGRRLGLPAEHAVPVVARLVAGHLPDAGPTVVLPRHHPSQLDAPRDAADLLRNVARSYGPGSASSAPGTPDGAITIQRLDHPDGARSWAVEIPGTETWDLDADVPTDLTTNLRLMAGLPDDMSGAVIEAMRQAGIPPDEPVVLAGHSQGGMVAVKVAALSVGLFDLRAVVTAGSPDLPTTVPSGVPTLHVRHRQDVVPLTDGEPDDASDRVVVLERRLPATDARGEPSLVEAHAVGTYVETVVAARSAAATSPALRAFDDALAEVLGPDGTTAVTLQYQATRDPELVRTDPATGLPRPATLGPALAGGRP